MAPERGIINIAYPQKDDLVFDLDYYLTKHMNLVQSIWGPQGMLSYSVTQLDANDASGMHVVARVVWESKEKLDAAMRNPSAEMMEDVKNYTNGPPSISLGKEVAVSA